MVELFRVGPRGSGQILYSARRRPRRLPKGVKVFDFWQLSMYQAVSRIDGEKKRSAKKKMFPSTEAELVCTVQFLLLPPGPLPVWCILPPPSPPIVNHASDHTSSRGCAACLPVSHRETCAMAPLPGKLPRCPGPHPGLLWVDGRHRSHVVRGLISQGSSTHTGAGLSTAP